MNQIAEDGERRGVGVLERQRDGVADAEAHAEMFRADDLQSLPKKRWCYPKVKCVRGRYCRPRSGTVLSARQ